MENEKIRNFMGTPLSRGDEISDEIIELMLDELFEKIEEKINQSLESIDSKEYPEFGGMIEIDQPCRNCECTFIVEIYDRGTLNCLECGLIVE